MEALRLAVRLAEGGILVLADRGGRPGDVHVGGLVRALLADHSHVAVCVDAADLEGLDHGAVVVYAPRQRDAAALNLGRALLAERALRVVLWCESQAAAELAVRAPDVFDWISHRFEVPSEKALVPSYVVATLRRADEEGVAVAWPEKFAPEPFIERTSPEKPALHRVKGSHYSLLVHGLGRAPSDAWVFILGLGEQIRHRARWAMAEVGRRRRVLLVGANPGLWPVTVPPLPLADALNRLRHAGAGLHAGRIAALVDLERGAVRLATALLRTGVSVDRIIELVSTHIDPGAALAQELARAGMLDLDAVARGWPPAHRPSGSFDARDAAMPLLRGLAGSPEIRARRDRQWLETAHAIEQGEPVEHQVLGWWAATAPGPEPVPLPLLELPRGTLTFAIEASLWDSRWHVHPGLRAAAASKLGELEAAERWASDEPGSMSEVLSALGVADRARSADRFAESLDRYDAALHLARRERMPLPLVADIHARRAIVLHELGRYAQVCVELEPVVRDVAEPGAMAALGRALVSLWRDLERAHELLQRALRVQQRTGEHRFDPFVVVCCVEEAIARGRYSHADELLAELGERALGHMSLISLSADLRRRQGRIVEARHLAQRGLASSGPRSDASAALATTTLAAIFVDGGDYVSARACLSEALSAAVAAFGEHHPSLATIALWTGRCWARLGKPSAAKAAFLGALPTTVFFFGEDHPRTHELRFELALARRVDGDTRANADLRTAFTRLEELLGSPHPEVVRMRHTLSGLRPPRRQ